MRIIIFILAVGICLTSPAVAEPPVVKLGADGGTLILHSKDSRPPATSGDTLYNLLSKEVQVFIYSNRTRVWNRPYPYIIRPGYGSFRPLANPQLESLIHKYARQHGVDPSLVRAVMRHESGFNPTAVSPKGAQGLMQLMPGTATLMGVNNPFDPEQNIAGGVGYLRRCLDRFQQNVPLAVAAYNAGPEAVARCGTIPPFAETQLFVQNVMGTYTGGLPLPGYLAPNPTTTSPAANRTNPKAKIIQAKSPSDNNRPRAKIIEVRSPKKTERHTSKAE